MRFEANLLVLGTKPEPDWVGKNATMKVTFSAAENHNVNEGTRRDPKWVTKSTSWFNMEAWGDVAEALYEEGLDVGSGIRVSGVHKIDKVQKDNEPARYYNKYIIKEYEVYKHDD